MKILLTKLRNDMNEQNAHEVFGTFVSILEAILAYHTFYFKEA
jgi:CRISPR/Cas system CSM-associated protein Csm2 small subunit